MLYFRKSKSNHKGHEEIQRIADIGKASHGDNQTIIAADKRGSTAAPGQVNGRSEKISSAWISVNLRLKSASAAQYTQSLSSVAELS